MPADHTAIIEFVEELGRAGRVHDVADAIRRRARGLLGSDGVTLVLRDGGECLYVEEDAIGPLWKGRRYPMSACITGWVMLNDRAAVVPDIYADPRVPHELYRTTFVKSLAVAPIRRVEPIGAMGVYWACPHVASPGEMAILQALADAVAAAIENARSLEDGGT